MVTPLYGLPPVSFNLIPTYLFYVKCDRIFHFSIFFCHFSELKGNSMHSVDKCMGPHKDLVTLYCRLNTGDA